MGDYQDPETLRRMYHDGDMSLRDIAQEFGVSGSTIRYWMERHSIERRERTEAYRLARCLPVPGFRIDDSGYEHWYHTYDREALKVYVHRLAAVAWFGLDAVRDRHVHHTNNVGWDNREDNLEMVDPVTHHGITKPWEGRWGESCG